MSISSRTIEVVKSRINIIDIISKYVSLKRRGKSFMCCCPFHNERTPSFSVSEEHNYFKCFGCGESGDAITFIQKIENIQFVDAIKLIANHYQIPIEEDNENPILSDQDKALAILQEATNFYNHNLKNNKIALNYLINERHLNNDIINNFSLGYSNNEWNSWLNYSRNNNYNIDIQITIGLLKKNNEQIYDSYRHRIIIPIHNVYGKVIAFSARTLNNEKTESKYINSIDSFIFHKSDILYGLYQAKSFIKENKSCFLVEGYFDVISLFKSGIKNTVATLGTYLSDNQCRLLLRFTNNVTIFYDGDKPGINATVKNIEKLLIYGFYVNVILLPNDQDPDNFINNSKNENVIEKLNEYKYDFIEFFRIINNNTNDINNQNDIIHHVLKLISCISDEIYKNIALKRINEVFNINIQNFTLPVVEQIENIKKEEKKESIEDKYEKEILRLLLIYGNINIDNQYIADHIFNELKNITFNNQNYQKIREVYQNLFDNNKVLDIKGIISKTEDENLIKEIIDLTIDNHSVSDQWENKFNIKISEESRNIKIHVIQTILRFKLYLIKKLIKEQENQLKTSTDNLIIDSLLDNLKLLKSHEINITNILLKQ